MKRKEFLRVGVLASFYPIFFRNDYWLGDIRQFSKILQTDLNQKPNEIFQKIVNLGTLNSFNVDELSKENAGLNYLIFNSRVNDKTISEKKLRKSLVKGNPFATQSYIPTLKEVQNYGQNNFKGATTKSVFEKLLDAGDVMFTAASLPLALYGGIMCASTGGVGCLSFLFLELPSAAISWTKFFVDENNRNNSIGNITAKTSLVTELRYTKFKSDFGFDLSKDFPENSKLRLSNSVSIEDLPLEKGIKYILRGVVDAKNENDLKDWLGKYIEEIGTNVENNIRDYIEAENKKSENKQLEAQQKAFFYQSLNNLASQIVGQVVKDPKLAAVFNVLLSAGLQFPLASMTPYGWAAIGINLVSAIFGIGGKDTFKEEVMKALQVLQKQLNVIIEQLKIIQENQIIIIEQLRAVLDEIITSRQIIVSKLDVLYKQNSRIYTGAMGAHLNQLEQPFLKAISALEIRALKGKDFRGAYDQIMILVGYLRVDTKSSILTTFDPTYSSIDGFLLKSKVFNPKNVIVDKPEFGIPLFDSMGSVSALANFDEWGGGTYKKAVFHLPTTYLVLNDLINWVIYCKLKKDEVLPILESIEQDLEDNVSILKEYCKDDLVLHKLDRFSVLANKMIDDLFHKMTEIQDLKLKSLYDNNDLKSIGLNEADGENWSSNSNNVVIGPATNMENLYIDAIPSFVKFFRDNGKLNIGAVSNVPLRLFHNSGKHYAQRGFVPSEFVGNLNPNNLQYLVSNSFNYTFKNININGQSIDFVIKANKILKGTDMGPVIGGPQYGTLRMVIQEIRTINIYFEFPGWKDIIRDKIQTSLKKDVSIVIPDFDQFDQFNQFLIYCNKQWGFEKKSEIIKDVRGIIAKQSVLDGFGTAAYVLGKLNEYIRSNSMSLYMIDYSEEGFTTDDYILALDNFALMSFEKEGKKFYEQILDYENAPEVKQLDKSIHPFYVKNLDNKFRKLDPTNWIDLMVIILKRKLHLSKQLVQKITRPVLESDIDPITKDCLEKIRSLKQIY